MFPKALCSLAEKLVEQCAAKQITITLAESCTGGLLAGLITSVAGSSAVFNQGFVTYSNEAKTRALGVDAVLLKQHGAVSEEVAAAMASGALGAASADIALSITGIAGPGGGSESKPVGLVYIGCAMSSFTHPACGGGKGGALSTNRDGGESPPSDSFSISSPPQAGGIKVAKNLFTGNRLQIRLQACERAIDMVLDLD